VITFPGDAAAVEASVQDLLPAERFWWHPDDAAWNRPPDDAAQDDDSFWLGEPVQARPAPEALKKAAT
jgi:hypothetical protein